MIMKRQLPIPDATASATLCPRVIRSSATLFTFIMGAWVCLKVGNLMCMPSSIGVCPSPWLRTWLEAIVSVVLGVISILSLLFSTRFLAPEKFRYQHPLHLAGTFTNFVDFNAAPVARNRKFIHEA